MDPIEPVVPAAPAEAPKKSSPGALIGLIIILLAIVAGAWYLWDQRTGDGPEDGAVEALSAQGTSTDAAAIESDLSAQSPDEFDTDMDAAFGELDAAFEAE